MIQWRLHLVIKQLQSLCIVRIVHYKKMEVFGLVVLFLVVVECRKLPSFVEPCLRTNPNITACILHNVELLRPRFLAGIPELFIPPLDPLVLPKASLDSGDQFSASFSDIQIYNALDFQLEKVHLDLEKFSVDLAIMFPSLRIKSRYELDGKLLVLQLKGQGLADGNYTNVYGKIFGTGVPFEKNGKTHYKIEDSKIDIDIGGAHLYFDRIFGDNEELNEQTNKVINENIKDLIGELKPVVIQVIRGFVLGICNRLFDRYTFDELFPNA
ncbi:unnamed protein product [Phaedon cochleariae]|uniref:Uncharacterized protein n=1 Tax=Phaedon cochleariae TaxID=80249 RepID=A0A9P0GHB0_PHACE|nr:unnamed protein product [Phaedon cochleariae]